MKTYIDAAKFEEIIAKFPGLTVSPQAGFVKVAGTKGHNVYVARTKTVGRVDISGFTMEHEGIASLPESEQFGNVKQQLSFEGKEPAILLAFEALMSHLSSLPAKIKPEAAKKEAKPKAQGWSEKVAPAKSEAELADEKAKRRALIEKVAKEKGVAVSANAAA